MREVRAPENPESLTDRETEVLKLLARGKANKQIAQSLYVSEKTVKAHVSAILMKLGVQSRTQAALYAVQGAGEPGRARRRDVVKLSKPARPTAACGRCGY